MRAEGVESPMDERRVRALMARERESLAMNLAAWRRAAKEAGGERTRMWIGEMTRGLSIALDAASAAAREPDERDAGEGGGRWALR
ncbi:MAG: hypothetical protein GX558_03360 [Clostridiales bacterium]|nr:hypothetical protein [Clostridiales bacterium]